MYNNSFFKKILAVASIAFLYSCDKDYNEIGAGLIGENNFNLEKETYDVIAYNQKTGPVQSNNLAVSPLGIYDNPNFGEVTANYGTQLTLETPITTIGGNPFIESVVLTIPYYSTITTSSTTTGNVYRLDSIYGAQKAKMKISIYESGYYMRDVDPVGGFQQSQNYFSNQNTEFDNVKVPGRLNDDANTAQNDDFFFDPTEFVVVTKDSLTNVSTTVRTKPGMQINLNKSYFKSRIIDAVSSGKLATNDVFKEYFRGLYFKMEKVAGSAGNLAMLDFKSGKITVKYNEDLASTTGGAPTRVKKTIVMNLTGNCVSLLKNNFGNSGQAYNALPNTGNTTEGDDKLYLKGGEGSVAVLSLFNVPGQLETIRNSGWLINEANLVFHIDASAMSSSYEPQRIYLYDFNNNLPVVDYFMDFTSNNTNVKKSKSVFDGMINLDPTTKKGITYKIRVTNQIRNLINVKDSINVKLGIAVMEDIDGNGISSHRLRTPNSSITGVPKGSVMNPLGTILYGSKKSVPENKRLKLEIFYTKPN